MKIPNYLWRKKLAGIYCIENVINNKKYIGSSSTLYTRLHAHRTKLKSNNHQNNYLQNAINKDGLENFECYIIEFITDISLLTEREQYWIDLLNPSYNITKEVIRNVISQESRIKISNTLKEGYTSGRINFTNTSKIDLYDSDGVYLKSYDMINDCCKELNIHASSIIRVLLGMYKQVKGYQFKYSNEDKIINKIINPRITTKFKNHKNKLLVPLKSDKLLENQEIDNQQPI